MIEYLRRVDFERTAISVLTHQDVFSSEFSKFRLPVDVVLTTSGEKLTLSNVAGWYRCLRDLSPDSIVLLQGGFFDIPLFLVLLCRLRRKRNLIVTEHLAAPEPPRKTSRRHFGLIPGIGLWWYKSVWLMGIRGIFPDKIVAVSHGIKKRLVEWGYPEEKITVISHGVDVKRFCPCPENRQSVRKQLGIPADATVVISTARFEPVKRIDRLVEAFNALFERNGRLWLVCTGDGSLRKEIEEQVLCKDRVVFLGFVDQETLAEVLQASDIFVLSSDNEGFPIALVEAMATGLLCIATRVTGSVEMIHDGDNGFLAHTSSESILDTLDKVINLDSELQRKVSQKARETALENFDIKNEINSVLDTLEIARAEILQ
jgi:glycosyltransferase involved in cell wall biosynthesis